jgi:non-specific serine/threonine protein kinase
LALPYLVKHIYNNGSEEVIRRGKKIHALGNVELIEYDELMNAVVFRVKDDTYSTYYKVFISQFKDPKTISIRCTCPYNLSEICRHKAGALFQLQEMLDRNMLGEREMRYDQKHTVVKMKLLELKMIRMLSSPENFEAAEDYLKNGKAIILEAKEERVRAEVEVDKVVYKLLIQKNEERNFDTSCNCNSDDKHPLCMHKDVVLLQLLNMKGPNYFDSIRNWDKDKNKLLSLYGYSLDDDLKNKFEFTYVNNKPFLKVLDPSIKRMVASTTSNELRPKPSYMEMTENSGSERVVEEMEESKKSAMKLGIVVTTNELAYPYIQMEVVQGEADEDFAKYTGKVEKLDLSKFINTEVFSEEDKMLLQQIRKLMPSEVNKYLNRNSPFSGIWENIIQQHDDELPEETRHLINEYLQPKYKKIFADLGDSNFAFYLPAKKTFFTSNLIRAELSGHYIAPEFSINYLENNYEVECRVKLPLAELNITENESETPLFFQYHNQFYTWQRTEDVMINFCHPANWFLMQIPGQNNYNNLSCHYQRNTMFTLATYRKKK